MTKLRAISLTAVAFAGLLTLTAAVLPSHAADARRHVTVKTSKPARNDSLATAPKDIQLWFSEQVDLKVTHVTCATAKGVAVPLTPITRDDTMAGMEMPVVAGFVKPIGSGSYAISWDAVAKDGEKSKGTIRFVVK